MTPANPDNNKPFIYRIADALGITHLVVAVQHSHLMSEIEGLISALAGKSDTGHTHKLIQYNQSASTDGFAGFTISGAGNFTIGVLTDKSIDFQFGPTVKASITNSNVDNLARALRTPDSTPTANSDNLVTSGGVAAALAQKANKRLIDNTVSGVGRAFIQLGTDDETEINVEIQVAKNGVTDNADITVDNIPNLQRALQTPDSTPTANSDKLVKSGGVKAAIDEATSWMVIPATPFDVSILQKDKIYTALIQNKTGDTVKIGNCFDISKLPSGENGIFFNQYLINEELADGEECGVRMVLSSQGVYICYDGKFEY